jgi:hypothetical protein
MAFMGEFAILAKMQRKFLGRHLKIILYQIERFTNQVN